MKTTTSERRHAAPAKRKPKRRPSRRAHGSRGTVMAARTKEPAVVVPELVDETPGTVLPVEPFADKRDEELSDEESLDREERQELY